MTGMTDGASMKRTARQGGKPVKVGHLLIYIDDVNRDTGKVLLRIEDATTDLDNSQDGGDTSTTGNN